MRRLFVSDVHLAPHDAARAERLRRFLEDQCRPGDELYILGDLFDYWVGPKHLDLPDYREALDVLRATTASGVLITFVLGNRDFYMGPRFSEETGIQVAAGRTEHRLTSAGRQVYLCHGDYLEDRRDAGFKVQGWIRSRLVEAIYTRLPVRWQTAGAAFYRRISQSKVRRPSSLAPEKVLAEFGRGTDIIVCGHVHRQGREESVVGGRQVTLFTLGDWADGASYLVEEDGVWRVGGEAAAGA
jgi:UDP-2,3-diacylglucosamine hydrolase